VLTTRYVSVASLTATTLVPVLTIVLGEPLPYQIAGVLVTRVIWWAHRGNLKRLRAGQENRVRLPWSGGGRATPHGQGGA
jgi:acyl phosphate:glycerol-3-phosphate acyltransferase